MFDEESLLMLDPEKDARAVHPGSGLIRSFTVVYENRQGGMLEKERVVIQPGVTGSIFGMLELKLSPASGRA